MRIESCDKTRFYIQSHFACLACEKSMKEQFRVIVFEQVNRQVVLSAHVVYY
jgi:hypothetical protein